MPVLVQDFVREPVEDRQAFVVQQLFGGTSGVMPVEEMEPSNDG